MKNGQFVTVETWVPSGKGGYLKRETGEVARVNRNGTFEMWSRTAQSRPSVQAVVRKQSDVTYTG